MAEADEIKRLQAQARDDRKLMQKAERALAEIDRNEGLTDEQADVLAALRLRLEGKPRAKLGELLTAAGDISGKRDIGEVLSGSDKEEEKAWPEIQEKKLDWPGT